MKAEYDFSKEVKNPYMGKFIQNGKFIVEIEHDTYIEIVEYDIKTQNKTVLETIPDFTKSNNAVKITRPIPE